ncbi:MAG: MFS transporter [Ruminococcaceae bacterium]|nr:MFS transporter [Oscillospiraceae bacterium]
MTYKLTDKKSIRLLTVLGWMIYFSSYITRLNFGAILVEFIQSEGVMKSAASAITTALFITYGVGQLVSGFLGDRISPRLLIFSGLLIASFCNVIMPLVSPSIPAMAVVWGVNGMAQAMMWPPLVKICASSLRGEDYNRLMPVIGTSCAAATIAVYLISPLVISFSGWKLVFYIAAAVATVAAFLWFVVTAPLLKNISFVPAKLEEKKEKEMTANKAAWKLLPIILLSIAMLGILRDGITTWMPTFISETFKVESTVSILTGVAIPATHMFIGLTTYKVLVAMKRDAFAAIALYFAITTGFLLLLWISGTNSMVLSTLFIALGSGGLHGINSLQTYYLPELLGGTGKISFYAGLINSATYVGSALSTYLFAVISEVHGWDATIISWVIFAALGLLLTTICMVSLRKNGNVGRV